MPAKDTEALISLVRDVHDPSREDYERVLAGLPSKLAARPVLVQVDALASSDAEPEARSSSDASLTDPPLTEPRLFDPADDELDVMMIEERHSRLTSLVVIASLAALAALVIAFLS